MLDLSARAGFPLLFNPVTLEVSFGSEMAETLHSSRRIEAMLPVLPQFEVPPNAPAVLYHMYRDVHYPEMGLRETHGLRYDLSVFTHGMIGREYLKSLGHYHPLIPGTNRAYPEVYEVLYGEATFLMQKVSRTNPDVVEDFMVCHVAEGENVIIPPDYGHVTINQLDRPLITTNWVSDNFSSVYQPVAQRRGFAWYLTAGGWIRNGCYEDAPDPRKVEPRVFAYLQCDTLFGRGLERPESLSLLNEPGHYANQFKEVKEQPQRQCGIEHCDNMATAMVRGGHYCPEHQDTAKFAGFIEEAKCDTHPAIAVDFDGTIAQCDGWKGLEHMGDPIIDKAGITAREFLQELRAGATR